MHNSPISQQTRLLLISPALVALFCSALPLAHAEPVLSDDFESNSFSGGTGWSTDWTHSQNGGTFIGNQIDGSHSGGLFSGDGTSVITRSFAALDSGEVSASWSIKGLAACRT